jgi:hypothetical protein
MTRSSIGITLLVLLLLGACAWSIPGRMARSREQIHSGMLTTALLGDAFLEEWGPPTRTSTMTGEEIARAEWSGGSGGFSGSLEKGKQGYEVWDYDGQVLLVFVRRRMHLWLVSWKTDMTVPQLRDWSATRARSR